MQERGNVLLVDESDRPLRLMAKLAAHEQGLLHRAFSVFVFQQRSDGYAMLLQKRAQTKYHFGGLWTNATCGHPLEQETPQHAGESRLLEEMNIACPLRPAGSFTYRAQSSNGLIEHEIDHVLLGMFQGELPAPNPAEAESARFVALDQLAAELAAAPASFTPWFAQGYAVVCAFDPAIAAASGKALRRVPAG
jgi:isopentenyl-diphosphate delta-isomerase type 1